MSLMEGNKNKQFFKKEFYSYYDTLRLIDRDLELGKTPLNKMRQKLFLATTSVLRKAIKAEEQLSSSEAKLFQKKFREKVSRYMYKSKFLSRFYHKPRGYPGDYLMFEMIYDNRPISKGIGYLLDCYVLDHFLVKAVINRKNKFIHFLQETLSDKRLSAPAILNFGCGTAREIRDFFSEKKNRLKKPKITLVDQDGLGLKFAAKKVKNFKGMRFNFLKMDIMAMLGYRGNMAHFEGQKYDLVYSLGVLDYFRDNLLVKFVGIGYGLLKPGGRLIVAICSKNNLFCYAALRWLCDWNFYVRSPINTLRVIKDEVRPHSIQIEWEKSQQIFFLIVQKQYKVSR